MNLWLAVWLLDISIGVNSATTFCLWSHRTTKKGMILVIFTGKSWYFESPSVL